MKTFHKAKPMNLVGAVLLTLTLLLFGYTLVSRQSGNPMPQVFGWGYLTVISDSMGQAMPRNALIMVKAQDHYQAGDIVTYQDAHGSLVTHRLVSMKDGMAVTKGDMNKTEDPPFAASQIHGKVQTILPGLGAALLWLQSPVGIMTIGIIILLLWFQPWKNWERKAENKNER